MEVRADGGGRKVHLLMLGHFLGREAKFRTSCKCLNPVPPGFASSWGQRNEQEQLLFLISIFAEEIQKGAGAREDETCSALRPWLGSDHLQLRLKGKEAQFAVEPVEAAVKRLA